MSLKIVSVCSYNRSASAAVKRVYIHICVAIHTSMYNHVDFAAAATLNPINPNGIRSDALFNLYFHRFGSSRLDGGNLLGGDVQHPFVHPGIDRGSIQVLGQAQAPAEAADLALVPPPVTIRPNDLHGFIEFRGEG